MPVVVCFRNFFASGVDLDFGEAAWRPLECSVQSSDEVILQSVWDDITGVWSLMLQSSAKQSVDTESRELFEEASNYLDVLDYSRVNKKLIRE